MEKFFVFCFFPVTFLFRGVVLSSCFFFFPLFYRWYLLMQIHKLPCCYCSCSHQCFLITSFGCFLFATADGRKGIMVHTMATCERQRERREGPARACWIPDNLKEKGTCLFSSGLCFLVPPHYRVATATGGRLRGNMPVAQIILPIHARVSISECPVPADLQKLKLK